MKRFVRSTVTLVALATLATPLAAQRGELPPGVNLSTTYDVQIRPILAVRPFGAPVMLGPAGRQISAIIENDLGQSNRFNMLPAPMSLHAPGPVPYEQWNTINVVYLVTGELTQTASGYAVRLGVHDIPYGELRNEAAFALPREDAPEYRMAVHALSDQIVEWLFEQPGAAASRVAFVRRTGTDKFDLMVVDADGENLRRLAGWPNTMYSPVWSPDGSKLVYLRRVGDGEGWEMVERDMASGASRVLYKAGLMFTPAYSPDGSKIAFGLFEEGRDAQLYELDVTGGQPRRIGSLRGTNISPTYSPDGRQIAFQSNTAGRQHLYVMDLDNGQRPRLLTPVGERVEYAAPDWSPIGSTVMFHGQSRGGFQIMVADATRPGTSIQQFTTSGDNEDPSVAPDGRHVVFTGTRSEGQGLYVLDIESGERELRLLVRGDVEIADWSNPLARPVRLPWNQ